MTRYAQSGADLVPRRTWGSFFLAGTGILIGCTAVVVIAAKVAGVFDPAPTPPLATPVVVQTPAEPARIALQPVMVPLPLPLPVPSLVERKPEVIARELPIAPPSVPAQEPPAQEPARGPDTHVWIKPYRKLDGTFVEGHWREKTDAERQSAKTSKPKSSATVRGAAPAIAEPAPSPATHTWVGPYVIKDGTKVTGFWRKK